MDFSIDQMPEDLGEKNMISRSSDGLFEFRSVTYREVDAETFRKEVYQQDTVSPWNDINNGDYMSQSLHVMRRTRKVMGLTLSHRRVFDFNNNTRYFLPYN